MKLFVVLALQAGLAGRGFFFCIGHCYFSADNGEGKKINEVSVFISTFVNVALGAV